MRFANVFLLTVVTMASLRPATGAADPKKSGKVPGWGTFVNPTGECRVEGQKNAVTITVPGTHHNLNPLPKFDNTLAPRVLKEVDGDFDVRVEVRKYPQPKADTSNNSVGHSYVGAGLLLWQDDTNFMRWFRAANGDRGDVFVHVEGYQDGELGRFPYAPGVRNKNRVIADKDLFLRLTRKGDLLTFYRSVDGEDWEPFAVFRNLKLDKKLRVGVAAVNSTTAVFAPTFEGFKLKTD